MISKFFVFIIFFLNSSIILAANFTVLHKYNVHVDSSKNLSIYSTSVYKDSTIVPSDTARNKSLLHQSPCKLGKLSFFMMLFTYFIFIVEYFYPIIFSITIFQFVYLIGILSGVFSIIFAGIALIWYRYKKSKKGIFWPRMTMFLFSLPVLFFIYTLYWLIFKYDHSRLSKLWGGVFFY